MKDLKITTGPLETDIHLIKAEVVRVRVFLKPKLVSWRTNIQSTIISYFILSFFLLYVQE